ncbi:hypothetical protein [uncultured Thiodictyon sp.]|uniref:hypothetical protein n=1 Tax=uncultured Thiodictyon sp. TaxID=1846217 RepID=UPI0025FE2FA7|nr:hypothetical protein [uncultured Thiodictyon sp.]
MAKGQFYEIKAGDVWQAASVAQQAAALTDRLEPTRELISRLAAHTDTDPFVRKHLLAPL